MEITRRIGELERRVSLLEKEVNGSQVRDKRDGKLSNKGGIQLQDTFPLTKRLFHFTDKGEIIFTFDREKLNIEEKITLYLMSKAYSKLLGKSDTDVATNNEISQMMKIPYNSTRGSAANNLRRKGIIISENGEHRIVYGKVKPMLNQIKKIIRTG